MAFTDNLMYGYKWSQLKKNWSLIPVMLCNVAGISWTLFYVTRVALKSPDISMNPRVNKAPWEKYRNGKNYRLWDIYGIEIPCQAPIYEFPEDKKAKK